MLFARKSALFFFVFLVLSALVCSPCEGQVALLLEEPYGFFGALNPTGHNALYFSRICAETPVKLRRCGPGELGAVIARYQGIKGYDWIAIPLIPYLYSVETGAQVPDHADSREVNLLRDRYHEAHLQSLDHVRRGNFIHGGWTQLLGTAYERRTYVFRFETTPEHDDALIDLLNSGPNHSHFNLFYNNCADFARQLLNTYFPGTFKRSIFPDAGMTTPKQLSFKLVNYARKHPDQHLQVYMIPQIPGYRRLSRANKSIAESLTTTAYALPIVLLNPYLAGGIFADYLARGRYHLTALRHSAVLTPAALYSLTGLTAPGENPASAGLQAPGAVVSAPTEFPASQTADSSLEGIRITNE
jgi:hypothetical protein